MTANAYYNPRKLDTKQKIPLLSLPSIFIYKNTQIFIHLCTGLLQKSLLAGDTN